MIFANKNRFDSFKYRFKHFMSGSAVFSLVRRAPNSGGATPGHSGWNPT
jgi:hypothetical protein